MKKTGLAAWNRQEKARLYEYLGAGKGHRELMAAEDGRVTRKTRREWGRPIPGIKTQEKPHG